MQDLIAICLCVGLFGLMVLERVDIFRSLFLTLHFHEATADNLSLLILVELFRSLILYVKEQRVSIGVDVEIVFASVLRVWLPPTVAGIDP